MLTREEIERLAAAISALRPDWPMKSLETFIHQRGHRPLLDLSVELVWVAQLGPERAQTPALIDQQGPWKGATLRGRSATDLLPVIDFDTACTKCLKPLEHPWHGGSGSVNDCVFEAPKPGVPPPDTLRQLIGQQEASDGSQ